MLSDMTIIVNPTNHSYFNLDGHKNGTILRIVWRYIRNRYLKQIQFRLMRLAGLYRERIKWQNVKDGAVYNKQGGVCFETQFYTE